MSPTLARPCIISHGLLNIKTVGWRAAVTRHLLIPDISKTLDAEALMIGVITGEVAICFQSLLRVTAAESELFKVAHVEGETAEAPRVFAVLSMRREDVNQTDQLFLAKFAAWP